MKKILDLYCGAGLAAIGYKLAGFWLHGVDIETKSTYAGHTFQECNALTVLDNLKFCRQFDAIHASPPCQAYSASTGLQRSRGGEYPDLVGITREKLERVGVPYVIENVSNAPIRPDISLYGWMFDLHVMRKRNFELGGWFMMQPGIKKRKGTVLGGDFISCFGNGGYVTGSNFPKGWRPKFDKGNSLDTWHFAMGIPEEYRFKFTEIAEGIPPAYTQYIGTYLLEYLNSQK